jgi:hypothetical protein
MTVTTTLRYVPEMLPVTLGNDGKIYRNVPVTGVIAHPPGTHPTSCIYNNMIAVEIKTPVGSRWYGTDKAYIDSNLRMAMAVNDRDEVLAKWDAVPTK